MKNLVVAQNSLNLKNPAFEHGAFFIACFKKPFKTMDSGKKALSKFHGG
jgi:hypothetical protein